MFGLSNAFNLMLPPEVDTEPNTSILAASILRLPNIGIDNLVFSATVTTPLVFILISLSPDLLTRSLDRIKEVSEGRSSFIPKSCIPNACTCDLF